MGIYAKLEMLGLFLTVLSYWPLIISGTGQPYVVVTHIPQAFDLGCLCLSGLTINQLVMVAEIVKFL